MLFVFSKKSVTMEITNNRVLALVRLPTIRAIEKGPFIGPFSICRKVR